MPPIKRQPLKEDEREKRKMKRLFTNLTAIEYSEPETMNEYGYKYTIRDLCTAYKTDEGFKNFLSTYNLKIEKIEETTWKMTDKKIKIYYFKPIEIDEPLTFWKIEDVKNMKPFIGLENGSYVVCYYRHHKNGVEIKRPNPNAKNVYIPLDYMEMAKIYG